MYVAPGALSARFLLSPRVIGDGYLVVAEPVVSGRNSVVGYIETQVKRAGEQHTRQGAAQEGRPLAHNHAARSLSFA